MMIFVSHILYIIIKVKLNLFILLISSISESYFTHDTY